jgi:hypothetical protein
MELSAEAVFVASYALLLCAVAHGLHRLGRVNTDAWSSRVLAGYRQQTRHDSRPGAHADWPHSEARRLHTAFATVAASAGLLLCMGEALRHHGAGDLAVLGGAGVLCLFVLRGLAAGLRADVSA